VIVLRAGLVHFAGSPCGVEASSVGVMFSGGTSAPRFSNDWKHSYGVFFFLLWVTAHFWGSFSSIWFFF